ncbi:MAG: hypothetical protein P857_358 [Candidatus Xenolissoclinum pacificiensis L6]|uniref:Uncharacterized protein n=1 Tax=Candidatus Xenolissoclinum pacificiensis L6 TaxID=1401685 RepID=W2V1W7_9RICK|nr:MAG: hypothetical protein P857_358 [Candidatus Xenolissoclinum pacificiensis L6]
MIHRISIHLINDHSSSRNDIEKPYPSLKTMFTMYDKIYASVMKYSEICIAQKK